MLFLLRDSISGHNYMRKIVRGRGINTNQSSDEETFIKRLNDLKKKSQKFGIGNLNETTLFARRKTITRILYYDYIYKLILNKPGVICEFGVQYGSTISLLTHLRGIYEPYNHPRKIIGFDTFTGFTNKFIPSEKVWKKGDLSVEKNYEKFLEKILDLHEQNSPISHIKKFELVKGDATLTFPKYLKKNPQTLISLAIFDMDVYYPTKQVLKKILHRMYKGSVLVFDELNSKDHPGETQALLETLNIRKLKLKNFYGTGNTSYCVLDDKLSKLT